MTDQKQAPKKAAEPKAPEAKKAEESKATTEEAAKATTKAKGVNVAPKEPENTNVIHGKIFEITADRGYRVV